MAEEKEAEEIEQQEASKEKDDKPGLSDGWVTLFIIIVMACACVAAWWLAMRETVPGAPGAPIGNVSRSDQ